MNIYPKESYMTRRKSRETAFTILFEQMFTEEKIEVIVEQAKECRDLKVSSFVYRICNGVEENKEEIENIISKYSSTWTVKRITKVSLTILKIAVFELKFLPDVPVNVSVSEAVDIAKIYGGKDDASFVNGVLSSIVKDKENICEKEAVNN
jgi:N utilization substance protein B